MIQRRQFHGRRLVGIQDTRQQPIDRLGVSHPFQSVFNHANSDSVVTLPAILVRSINRAQVGAVRQPLFTGQTQVRFDSPQQIGPGGVCLFPQIESKTVAICQTQHSLLERGQDLVSQCDFPISITAHFACRIIRASRFPPRIRSALAGRRWSPDSPTAFRRLSRCPRCRRHPGCFHPNLPNATADTKHPWFSSRRSGRPPHHGVASAVPIPVWCAPAKFLTCRPPSLPTPVPVTTGHLPASNAALLDTRPACTASTRGRNRRPRARANPVAAGWSSRPRQPQRSPCPTERSW